MSKRLQALFGLKWNPFTPEVPVEAFLSTAAIDSFLWRVEQLVTDGGFALISGEPGSGKTAVLRLVAERLKKLPDLRVEILSRPQSRAADFYRELGELFGLTLSPHNRWASTKVLRECWQAHIERSLFRPVVLVDEAQEMLPPVLGELRLLSATQLDTRVLLSCVLCGDSRLLDKLRLPELLPLASRMRARLPIEAASQDKLRQCLVHTLEAAGNRQLLTPALIDTLCAHAAGNHRVLMNLGAELLAAAVERNLPQIDEKLFFELYNPPRPPARRSTASASSGGGR
jgi:type II secretory pathway predicted ATPase ExeA